MARLLVLVLAVLVGGCATRGPLNIDCPQFETALRQELPLSQLEREITGNGHAVRPQPSLTQALDLLRRQESGTAGSAQELVASRQRSLNQMQSFNNLLDRVLLPRGRSPSSVLLLSGGGQWGAFGAGLLKELHQRRELPEFSIITGVSTGGLQSMFVAVNDADAYAELIKAYSPETEGEIVDRNAPWQASYKGSMAGLQPLRKRIEDGICRGLQAGCLMDRLAQQAGRKAVLIGFVEAETGKFYFADAVQLANLPDRAAARQCLTGIALASSAMPVFFQPVSINGKTYYDGGVRQSVFTARLVSQLNERLLRSPFQQQPAPSIYVVRNGPTALNRNEEVDGSGKAMTAAMRAYSIIVNQVEVGSIAALRTENSKGPISLITADGYSEVGNCRKTNDKAMFDPPFMSCLRSYGQMKAAVPAAQKWISLSTVPLPADPSGRENRPGLPATGQVQP